MSETRHSFRAVAWTAADKHGRRGWDVEWIDLQGNRRAQVFRTTEQNLRRNLPRVVVEVLRHLE
jgi:hypothetical protein